MKRSALPLPPLSPAAALSAFTRALQALSLVAHEDGYIGRALRQHDLYEARMAIGEAVRT
jgi:hypothetical protein